MNDAERADIVFGTKPPPAQIAWCVCPTCGQKHFEKLEAKA